MGKKNDAQHKVADTVEMEKFFPRSVLITQGELVGYAGSEIVTLELAEYFSQHGCHVDVLTHSFAGPIVKEFKRLPDVTVHTEASKIQFELLDLVWIHHQLIPVELLDLAERGGLRARIIFHHMSPYHPLEFPFAPRIEQYLADQILFNSKESQAVIESKLSSINFHGAIFNNPAPDVYLEAAKNKHYRTRPKNILMVSNHPPSELDEAVKGFVDKGLRVRNYGMSSGWRPRRVTPKDLAWADVVISIGKTVQYGILGNTPVYCYDHFGGPGYLGEANFELAAQLNFSGRGFAKKRSATIVKEVLEGYRMAQDFARESYPSYAKDYTLSAQFAMFATTLQPQKRSFESNLSPEDRAAFDNLSGVIARASKDLSNVRAGYTAVMNDQAKLVSTLGDIVSSRSWKITKPLRQVNKNFFRRKEK